jgi:hypothetical protein
VVTGPHFAEAWPDRLRASGMGFGHRVGNLGKIIGLTGLAPVIAKSDYVSPRVTLYAIVPAFLFLAYWYPWAAIACLLPGIETKGRPSRRLTQLSNEARAGAVPGAPR